jgi:hypothetical protein
MRCSVKMTILFVLGMIAANVAKFLRSFDQMALTACPFFVGGRLVSHAIDLLGRHVRGFGPVTAARAGRGG